MLSTMRLAILLPLLSACVSPGCSAVPLTSYDRAFELRLAGELDTAPPGSAWPTAVVDYVRLRDAVRACRG